MALLALVLRKHPKKPSAWAHRWWCVMRRGGREEGEGMAAQESSPCDSAATAAWAQLLQDEAQLTAEVGRKGGMLDSCEATLTWDGACPPACLVVVVA